MKPYIDEETALILCKKYVDETWNKAREMFGVTGRVPTIRFKKFGFKSVAKTIWWERDVLMNTNYLYSSNVSDFLESVVVHEVCHILNHIVYNGSGHDGSFKRLCDMFGTSGSACDSFYNLPDNFSGYIMECSGCGNHAHFIRRDAFHKALAGGFTCARCATRLNTAIILKTKQGVA